MRRKSANIPGLGSGSLVNGRVTALDRHGYGKIAVGDTGETVHFKLSQVRAPRGHVLVKKARKGTDIVGTPVKVSARDVGDGTLMAGSVIVGPDSGKLIKAGIGAKGRSTRLTRPMAAAASHRLSKLKK